MARTKLALVSRDLSSNLLRATRLVSALSHGRGVTHGSFNQKQFENIVELAYMQGFLAWESFLEESFLLYLLGKPAPNGFRPRRYSIPTSREHAIAIVLGEQKHSDWTAVDKVVKRARTYFRDGEPFVTPLQSMKGLPNDLKTLRNALAHRTSETQSKFEVLVRKELGAYPRGLTVGGFLDLTLPSSALQSTFLEHYFDELLQAAAMIVPT